MPRLLLRGCRLSRARMALAASSSLVAAASASSRCEGSDLDNKGLQRQSSLLYEKLGYHGTWAGAFSRIDTNNDGKLQKNEVLAFLLENRIHVPSREFYDMWDAATLNSKDPNALTEAEFKAFMEHTHQSYMRVLWTSMKEDPSMAGSVLYLTGSMLFAVLPFFKTVSQQTLTKCGQLLYIAGGCLFLSNCVSRHTDRVHHQLVLSTLLEQAAQE